MKVIIHPGAHHTDDDRLLKCLLRNKEDFSGRGVSVPGPGKYRTLLKDTFSALESADAAPGARDVLIDAILDDETADRMILSNAHFFGSPRFALGQDQFYPLAPLRLQQIDQLFEGDQIELYFAICNPATFIPNVLGKAPEMHISSLLSGLNLQKLRWSKMLERIREAVPDMPITVWCNEDTPMIWAQIIRQMAGLGDGEKIIGGFDLLSTIMTQEGMRRFRTYLHTHRNLDEIQKREVIATFLDKYAIEDAIVEELDLPGWTDELIEMMTELYDADVERILQMSDIQMIAP
ncbi:hypothetical protein ACXYMO_11545 [Arenibacterium sp. CAU 1754]